MKFTISFKKLTGVTTDGAASMVGKNTAFLALCDTDEIIPKFLDFFCIVHQESSRELKFEYVMNNVVKIINCIRRLLLVIACLMPPCKEQNLYNKTLLSKVRLLSRGTC